MEKSYVMIYLEFVTEQTLDLLLQVPFCEEKSVQLFRVAFFRSDLLQNPYFSKNIQMRLQKNMFYFEITFLFVALTQSLKLNAYKFFPPLKRYIFVLNNRESIVLHQLWTFIPRHKKTLSEELCPILCRQCGLICMLGCLEPA